MSPLLFVLASGVILFYFIIFFLNLNFRLNSFTQTVLPQILLCSVSSVAILSACIA